MWLQGLEYKPHWQLTLISHVNEPMSDVNLIARDLNLMLLAWIRRYCEDHNWQSDLLEDFRRLDIQPAKLQLTKDNGVDVKSAERQMATTLTYSMKGWNDPSTRHWIMNYTEKNDSQDLTRCWFYVKPSSTFATQPYWQFALHNLYDVTDGGIEIRGIDITRQISPQQTYLMARPKDEYTLFVYQLLEEWQRRGYGFFEGQLYSPPPPPENNETPRRIFYTYSPLGTVYQVVMKELVPEPVWGVRISPSIRNKLKDEEEEYWERIFTPILIEVRYDFIEFRGGRIISREKPDLFLSLPDELILRFKARQIDPLGKRPPLPQWSTVSYFDFDLNEKLLVSYGKLKSGPRPTGLPSVDIPGTFPITSNQSNLIPTVGSDRDATTSCGKCSGCFQLQLLRVACPLFWGIIANQGSDPRKVAPWSADDRLALLYRLSLATHPHPKKSGNLHLCGSSGSGKSSLLEVIGGCFPRSSIAHISPGGWTFSDYSARRRFYLHDELNISMFGRDWQALLSFYGNETIAVERKGVDTVHTDLRIPVTTCCNDPIIPRRRYVAGQPVPDPIIDALTSRIWQCGLDSQLPGPPDHHKQLLIREQEAPFALLLCWLTEYIYPHLQLRPPPPYSGNDAIETYRPTPQITHQDRWMDEQEENYRRLSQLPPPPTNGRQQRAAVHNNRQ
jgi:hypothetical protein